MKTDDKEYLEDTQEYVDIKIRMQIYCIPGTRDDKGEKDYTYVIGGPDGGPAALSGIVHGKDLQHVSVEITHILAEGQERVQRILHEYNLEQQASDKIVTANFSKARN